MFALALAVVVTFVSGERAWLIETKPDELQMRWDYTGPNPTRDEAIAAAQAYLDKHRHGCKAGYAASTRVPGYGVAIECPKRTDSN